MIIVKLVLLIHHKDILLAPADESKIYDAEISQPACTAIQLGLVEILKSWNVNPSACVGHSSGA